MSATKYETTIELPSRGLLYEKIPERSLSVGSLPLMRNYCSARLQLMLSIRY